MKQLKLGLVLLATVGCGEAPPIVNSSRQYISDVPCDLYTTGEVAFYFYMEHALDGELASVQTCRQAEPAFLEPECEPVSNYSVDEQGVLRVVCGKWDSLGLEKADFVRVGEVFPLI
jgi:hypothetical protein